jgi:hypothetical protein
MSTDTSNQKNLYKKNTKTEGVTENVAGEQTIQTKETRILKSNGKEILIGKEIEKVDKIKEGHESLQRRILNKLMK